MPLNVPTRNDLRSRMVMRLAGRLVALTDLTPISTLRQIMEAVVEELAALWRGLVEIQRDFFIDTATGDRLDRRLADYGLARPGAQRAYGTLLVTADSPIFVPAGVIVRTVTTDGSAPKRYRIAANSRPDQAQGDVGTESWWCDLSREVMVEAVEFGAVGNTAAGAIAELENPVAHVVSVSNPSPLINGTDAASDAEYREYFRLWIRSLTRGTRGALLAGLRSFVDANTGRRVHSVALEEWGGTQLLDQDGRPVALKIIVDEGLGAVHGAACADPALISAVTQWVMGDDSADNAGQRSAGVPTAVVPATALALDVAVNVDVDTVQSVQLVTDAVRHAVLRHFVDLPCAGMTLTGELQGQFSLAHLFRDVVDVPGVLRATFSTPVSDVRVPVGFKAVAGLVSVTGQSAT